MEGYKKCYHCGEVKPFSEFYKRTRSKDGYGFICKKCHGEYKSEWEQKKRLDPEWVKKQRAKWREEYHKRKAELVNHPYRNLRIGHIAERLRKKGINLRNKDAHHWNYNEPYSVIVMAKSVHRRLHKHLKVNYEDKYIYTLDGRRLETAEESLKYYEEVLLKYYNIYAKMDLVEL